MQPGKEKLAGNAVIVSDSATGQGKTENAVKHDRIKHQLSVPTGCGVCVLCANHGDALPESGQIAAQLLKPIKVKRHALLNHERIEGQVTSHVSAVMNQIPHHKGFFGQRLVIQQSVRISRELQLGDLHRVCDNFSEACCFSVGEDCSPAEGR